MASSRLANIHTTGRPTSRDARLAQKEPLHPGRPAGGHQARMSNGCTRASSSRRDRNAVGEQQRFTDHANDLLVLCRSGERVRAQRTAQRSPGRQARPARSDRTYSSRPGSSSGWPARRSPRAAPSCRYRSARRSARWHWFRTGRHHATANSARGHRFATTSQRSCPQGTTSGTAFLLARVTRVAAAAHRPFMRCLIRGRRPRSSARPGPDRSCAASADLNVPHPNR